MLGAPKDIVDELKQEKKIEVFPENWPVVLWFLSVCDFIAFRHDGRCLGLDMQDVKAESEMGKREYSASDFKGLRVMSVAVARTINKVSHD